MFVKERQNNIIEQLHTTGSVLVKELAIEFKVSEDCIRKDLAALEKQGLLKRSYGGAVLERVNVHKEDVKQRSNVDLPLKKAIAKTALSLINDGDIVFLDISTINMEVARLLVSTNKKVTVVSNMVEIMLLCSKPCELNFIFAGGCFNRGHDGFIGSMTIEFLKNFRFDIALMGVVGADVHHNSVNTYVAEDGLTKREVLKHSRSAYMLCEQAKFEREGNFQYARMDDFTGIVTEGKLSKEVHKALKEFRLNIYTATM